MSLKVGDFVFQDYRIAKILCLNEERDLHGSHSGYTLLLDGSYVSWGISKNAKLFSLCSPLFISCMYELEGLHKINKKYKAFIREAIQWEVSQL